MTRKVGVMFGSFNPPHNGHATAIERALNREGLDRIFVIPVPQSPFKTHIPQINYEEKLYLCRLAFENDTGKVQIQPFLTSLTKNKYIATVKSMVQTLKHIQQQEGIQRLTLIAGEDFQKKFQRLQLLAQLLQNPATKTSLMLATQFNERSRKRALDILSKVDVLNKVEPSSVNHEKREGISSTFIREALRTETDLSPYVNESVRKYIQTKGLYR